MATPPCQVITDNTVNCDAGYSFIDLEIPLDEVQERLPPERRLKLRFGDRVICFDLLEVNEWLQNNYRHIFKGPSGNCELSQEQRELIENLARIYKAGHPQPQEPEVIEPIVIPENPQLAAIRQREYRNIQNEYNNLIQRLIDQREIEYEDVNNIERLRDRMQDLDPNYRLDKHLPPEVAQRQHNRIQQLQTEYNSAKYNLATFGTRVTRGYNPRIVELQIRIDKIRSIVSTLDPDYDAERNYQPPTAIPAATEAIPEVVAVGEIDIPTLRNSVGRGGYSLNQLKRFASQHGLHTSGTKQELVDRLLARLTVRQPVTDILALPPAPRLPVLDLQRLRATTEETGYSLQELRNFARSLGLRTAGEKRDLMRRLFRNIGEQAPEWVTRPPRMTRQPRYPTPRTEVTRATLPTPRQPTPRAEVTRPTPRYPTPRVEVTQTTPRIAQALIPPDIRARIDIPTLRVSTGRGGYSLINLREFARQIGINVSGSKADLVDRIVRALGEPIEQPVIPP